MNMKIRKFLVLMTFLGCLIQACEESEAPNIDLSGSGYYPLQVGNFWTYQMDQIDYLTLGNDTSSYELRELISDSIVTSSGEVTYLISRQLWQEAEEEWQTNTIWQVRKNAQSAVVTEDGVSFVKLVFPVAIGKEWNGHAFNNIGSRVFRYEAVEDREILSMLLDQDTSLVVKTVLSDQVSAIVGTDQRSEIYVNGIGLVQKDLFVIELCTESSRCPDNFGDTLSGIFLSQVLIDYGKL